MELILRGSEYQSFLDCRKKWFYQWVEGLEPKRPDGKLFFGTLFHKWLELYYNNGCNKLQADLETSIWYNEQDTADMEQTDLDDMLALARGVAEYYDYVYGANDATFKVLATELNFIVKLDEGILMEGTIDLVYEVNGKVRFADHKTVTSLDQYEEKSKMDRQISRYWWVMKMLSTGVAKVKDRSEGNDRWISFPDLFGKEIDGFDYNLIAKSFPKEPKVLKPKKGQTVGDLSQDKAQKTTYDKYMAKIVELGHDPANYTEMLEHLKSKQDPFVRRVDVLRNDAELEAAVYEFLYTAGDIHDIRMTLQGAPPNVVEMLTYRNIGDKCQNMCSFKQLCQTTIEGGHVSLVKNLGYKKREDVKA